jgi:hypothetical protein
VQQVHLVAFLSRPACARLAGCIGACECVLYSKAWPLFTLKLMGLSRHACCCGL